MQIFVEKLEFTGPHGFYEVERREGRRFQVDLSVEVSDHLLAARDDKLEHTLDYRRLAEVILAVGTGESYKLVERLGDEILTRIFDQYDEALSAELCIRKFAPDVPGEPACVGVRFERTRPTI